MSAITTHVLDIARGLPAAGVAVMLERASGDGWEVVAEGATDADGRLRTLLPEAGSVAPGTYRLTFNVRAYFDSQGIPSFFPHVAVAFYVVDGEAHHHVPLLVSPFGYSTYRGS
jgi:5-hydroxyisourate hydrolase